MSGPEATSAHIAESPDPSCVPGGPLLLWALHLPQLSPCDEGGQQLSLTKCRPLVARAAAPAPSILTPSAGPPLLSSFPELNRNWMVPSLPAGLLTCSGMPFHSLLGKLLIIIQRQLNCPLLCDIPALCPLPPPAPTLAEQLPQGGCLPGLSFSRAGAGPAPASPSPHTGVGT